MLFWVNSVLSSSLGVALLVVPMQQALQSSDDVCKLVISAAQEVFKSLGRGHSENVYEKALQVELISTGVAFSSQVNIAIHYKGIFVGHCIADLIIHCQPHDIIVELKAVEGLLKSFQACVIQVEKYMIHINRPTEGMLINFPQKDNCSSIEIVHRGSAENANWTWLKGWKSQ